MSSASEGTSDEAGSIRMPLPLPPGPEEIRVGRSRTACAACRVARRFCDRTMPCGRYDRSNLFEFIQDDLGGSIVHMVNRY